MIVVPSGLRSGKRKVYSALHKHALIHLPRRFERSTAPVTIIIPLAVKDLAQAEATISSLRARLLHPIEKIIVAGQAHPDVSDFCKRQQVEYVNENDVLPREVKELEYVTAERNRNGWIRQQVLKLSAPELAASETFLVMDSDTCLVRDLAFMRNGRPILFLADEYNPTYHACNHRLLGKVRDFDHSFVAHCMLFERRILMNLRAAIEKHCRKSWIEAILDSIDKKDSASFSEFELYGTYMFNFEKKRFQTAYWYNQKYREPGEINLDSLPDRYKKFNFVSKHINPGTAQRQ